MASLSDMLSYLRKRENLSQQELANTLKMTRSAIGMYETGKREPDLETLEAFADFYNVDMNTLTGRSSSEQKPANENAGGLNSQLHDLIDSLPPEKIGDVMKYIQFLKSQE